MRVSQAAMMGILASGLSSLPQMPKTLGAILADKVVPFNKGPRPEGQATLEQKAITCGPKKGKGTRRSRR